MIGEQMLEVKHVAGSANFVHHEVSGVINIAPTGFSDRFAMLLSQ